MKVLLFAGGSGKRFWPLGRESIPKQFIRMFNGKSTFELTIERLLPFVSPKDIYIFTHKNYEEFARKQGGHIPATNFYFEPFRKDVGPAVGYACIVMETLGFENEPVTIMWADHIVKNPQALVDALQAAENMLTAGKAKGVLVGIKPEYAATNLGWIKIKPDARTFAKTKNIQNSKKFKKSRSDQQFAQRLYTLQGFVYKPEEQEARRLFETRAGLWNAGYFVSTPSYILSYYKHYAPKLYEQLQQLKDAMQTQDTARFKRIYDNLEKIHFDHVVFYNLDPAQVPVMEADLQWLDVGSLRALQQYYLDDDTDDSDKSSVAKSRVRKQRGSRNRGKQQGGSKPSKGTGANIVPNIVQGKARAKARFFQSKNSMIINNASNQLVVGVGLDGIIVINTPDVVLVIKANKSKDLSYVVEQLKQDPHLRKYVE